MLPVPKFYFVNHGLAASWCPFIAATVFILYRFPTAIRRFYRHTTVIRYALNRTVTVIRYALNRTVAQQNSGPRQRF